MSFRKNTFQSFPFFYRQPAIKKTRQNYEIRILSYIIYITVLNANFFLLITNLQGSFKNYFNIGISLFFSHALINKHLF